jgi:hypothetical protein
LESIANYIFTSTLEKSWELRHRTISLKKAESASQLQEKGIIIYSIIYSEEEMKNF